MMLSYGSPQPTPPIPPPPVSPPPFGMMSFGAPIIPSVPQIPIVTPMFPSTSMPMPLPPHTGDIVFANGVPTEFPMYYPVGPPGMMPPHTGRAPLTYESEGSSLVSVTKVASLDAYPGSTYEEKIQSCINAHPVFLISKTFCPFCLELKRTFMDLGVPVHAIEFNEMSDGSKIMAAAKGMTNQKTVPMCWIKGQFYGGCDAVKKMHFAGQLEDKIADLKQVKNVTGAGSFATIKQVTPPRGKAVRALFWFPAQVNNWTVRMVGILVCVLCILCIVYRDDRIGAWIAAFLLFDYSIRFLIGSGMSAIGMLATVLTAPLKPDFKPGPPKQFASACGLCFSLVGTCCYFTENPIPGACIMGALLGAASCEGFLDFCFGCFFYQLAIRFKIIPAHVYRIYTNTRQEVVEAWNYENLSSNAPRPTPIVTEPDNAAALKYKTRTDEWTKDDFNLVRNMQVVYFAMPLSLAGLSLTFLISTNIVGTDLSRTPWRPWTEMFYVIGIMSVVAFCLMLFLYGLRLIFYPRKCLKEWDCPLRSPAFGCITLTFIIYSVLWFSIHSTPHIPGSTLSILFDHGEGETWMQTYVWLSRVLFWIGALGHIVMTVAKFGEWVGKSLNIEHVHATWMMLPVGNLVAAIAAPVVPALYGNNRATIIYDRQSWANLEIAYFFYSVGFVMWAVLFTITFFKTATTHNSDDRVRHGTFIWVAAPALIAIAEYLTCIGRNILWSNPTQNALCESGLSFYFYFAVIIFLGLSWASLPYINFFGRDQWSIYYWFECFTFDCLAATSALYYTVYGNYFTQTIFVIFLVIACTANAVALMWVVFKLFRRKTMFTPEYKWSPLSFMKLTHEAWRNAMPKLSQALQDVDVTRPGTVYQFCLQFSQFLTVFEQHSRHEDEVIFKTFDDFFPKHGARFEDDHCQDRVKIARFRELCDILLNGLEPIHNRMQALAELRATLPPFLNHFLEHLQGEEDHQNPVGKRYINIELGKQIVKKVFEITPAEEWEIIFPYLIKNMPRHGQRVRLIKCFCWAMPERAQQIGAMVYRNVDAVLWETISFELPEIIPRGVSNWRRFY